MRKVHDFLSILSTAFESQSRKKSLTSHDLAEEAIVRSDDLIMNLLDFLRALGSEKYVLV